ncbi:MAG: aspartate kinase [Acidobacteriota bacterium]|nr:aspartate kinase [Acidobacteriota bacterium]
MKKIVVKFGGSNLKKKEDLSKILSVIKMYKQPLVVVVSAVNGVTDRLIDALANVNHLDVDRLLIELSSIYQSFLDVKNAELETRIYEIKDLLLGTKLIGQVPDFIYDQVLSHGEKCSSLLLKHYFNQRGLDFEEALPEEFGLITDGRFKNATVELEAAEEKLKTFFQEDKNYVVPGFYGIAGGQVTLLGRGGSDYSATSIGYCLEAERVDLYKDVSGFMTCDPKCVISVKPVKKLNYDEAAELSYFGARILHQTAVEPVRQKNIPLYIYNLNSFTSIGNPDTIISFNGSVTRTIIKSLSFTDDLAVIRFKGSNVGRVPGLLGQIASTFGDHRINIKSVVTSQTSINVLISSQDVEKCKKLTSKMRIAEVEDVFYRTDISLIAAVGDGILKKPGVAARIFSAVSRHSINVEMISAGASHVTIYFLVNLKDRNRALQAIHKEFFGGKEHEDS